MVRILKLSTYTSFKNHYLSQVLNPEDFDDLQDIMHWVDTDQIGKRFPLRYLDLDPHFQISTYTLVETLKTRDDIVVEIRGEIVDKFSREIINKIGNRYYVRPCIEDIGN